ncbi:hypothetical protein [Acetatifactor aquisgranensis]|uniref:hypothetical protein n=1 Tax=Acetatifactor aquisgranensis TaxID=2941233 RepID=UPI0020406359|nr:hypothetical protein [Acetatifactor aquisgranensis]MCI8544057.1 DUF4190 domain-containing protein [Lachnospiraceae bacterium]
MDNNWNGNNGQQDRWNSNASNSSYYNQPTHRPYGQTFSIASAICGLLAMTTSCTIILSLPLGALGILFAVLAHRTKKKMNTTCVTGIALSCVGLVSAVSMIVYSFVMLPSLMENEAFRNQVNAVSQQLYGMDFDVFMEETYGYSFDD